MKWLTEIVVSKESVYYYFPVCEIDSEKFDYDGEAWRKTLEIVRKTFPEINKVFLRAAKSGYIQIENKKVHCFYYPTYIKIPFNLEEGLSYIHEKVENELEKKNKTPVEKMLEYVRKMDASGVEFDNWPLEDIKKYNSYVSKINRERRKNK